MKKKLSKLEAKEQINKFFKKENFTLEEVKKIRRFAMKFSIKLADYRKLFCKKCSCKLTGRTRINKTYKTVECEKCGYKNKFKMN